MAFVWWPQGKRELESIAAAGARDLGALPVGVFVDEEPSVILEHIQSAGLEFAQLHGDGARSSLSQLPDSLPLIYVLHANSEGTIVSSTPEGMSSRQACSLDLRTYLAGSSV
jgi:phosphoribosylanthranilate isomerase